MELWCTKRYLVPHLLNINADIIFKTPFGNTQAFTIPNLVKPGTVLGLTLSNCSLGKISDNGQNYQYGGRGGGGGVKDIPTRIC